jgi:putative DNA primase/helicase
MNTEKKTLQTVKSEPNFPAFKDEILKKVTEIIFFYAGYIIFSCGKFYICNEKSIWKAYSRKEMLKILINEHVYDDKQATKIAPLLLKTIENLTYEAKFPEPDHSIFVFKNVAIAIDFDSIEEIELMPEHYVRNSFNFNFDSEAKCPVWDKTLDYTFEFDEDKNEKIKLLQECFGYSMTSSVELQKMIMLHGFGANGKTLILKVLSEILGQHNLSTVAMRDLGNRFSPVKLHNKLVNIDSDCDDDAMKYEGRIKAIVSGDAITVEEKNQPAFSFSPYAKLWMATNSLPKVKNNTYGFYRRLIILMFNRIIKPEDQNQNLFKELQEELPGIFWWSLQGLKRIQETKNLTIPKSSQQIMEEYQCDNNLTKKFFTETLELLSENDPSFKSERILKQMLYNDFKTFLSTNGFGLVDSIKFGKELKALDVEQSKSGANRYYNVRYKTTSN